VSLDARSVARRLLFWLLMLALPTGVIVLMLGLVSYWTVAKIPIRLSDDPIIAYDPEIGFVPRPNSRSTRADSPALTYHIYTDRRGARVSAPGEQTPDQADIVFIGDSFTWGHGVENLDTYASKVPKILGLTGANLALGSYGTTQALQMLRRNADLRPKLVVYPIITDHLRRNVSACAPSYYPFCADVSYVAVGPAGTFEIRPPRTNGVDRMYLQVQYEQAGLAPMAWLTHGFDVAIARIAARAAEYQASRMSETSALHYLLSELSSTAKDIGADLLVVFIPMAGLEEVPPAVAAAARELKFDFLDVSEPMRKRGRATELYLPDGHPNAAGHQFIADQIITATQRWSRRTQGRLP